MHHLHILHCSRSLEHVKTTKVPHSMVKAEAFSEGTVCAKREGKVGLGMIGMGMNNEWFEHV